MTHAARLAATGAVLARDAELWRPRPFAVDPPPWAARMARGAAWLAGLSDGAVDSIEAADRLPPEAPSELLALEGELADLAARSVDRTASAPRGTVAGESGWRIPARKRAQIAAFAEALGAAPDGAERVVDWCAGKAHLGRTLAARWGQPVTALECEAGYRDEAEALAARAGVTLGFVAVDVLAEDPRLGAALGAGVTAVALHACGGLGLRLLRLAASDGASAVALAPCCYHRAHPERIPAPLSRAGREIAEATGLTLDHSALRLATADEVVARARLRRGRRRENAWRLGFDLLHREATGVDAYAPLGVLPPEVLERPFAEFATALATVRGLALPTAWDPARAEAAGWERARRARALGLLRGLYRRTIELHLVLDRAQFLVEAGYDVEVVTFCPRAVSPRNLLVIGRRAC